jgi:oleate hydratase
LLRATRTLNNDEAFLGEGILRRLLGGTYFEHILPLGPNERPEDLHHPAMFEQQLIDLRSLFEKSYTLQAPKRWIRSAIDALRGRN